MKRRQKTVAVIAAYNEEIKISEVVSAVDKYVNQIVVVDDGSSDKTSEVVKNHKVIVLRHLINLGQGAALQTGFEYSKSLGADIVVTYDADGQFKASEIPRVIEPIVRGRADVVLGSRFLGKTKNIPILRIVILKLGIFFTKVFSGVSLTDVANGFRAFSAKALEKIEIKHNRWAHLAELIYLIGNNNLKFVEVPVTVYYTRYSTQKGRGQPNTEALRIPFALITQALLGT